ncbi:MAG: entericidin [Phycisphaerae bacterium]|nr:entericidin [Phycisphaerae bacterium]
MQILKQLAIVGVIAMWTVGLTGCNTVEGVGDDIQALGKGTSDAAASTKDKISGDDKE